MTNQKFWSLLVATCLITGVCLILIDQTLPTADAISLFTVVCIAVFTLVNIAAFFLGKGAVQSNSQYRFIHLMMFLIIIKMVICVALVVAYVKLGQPQSKMFVVPFLLIYLTFTIFEIYVLQNLAHVKPHNEHSEASQ